LLGYFRDVMTQAVGCSENQLLYALPAQREEIRSVAQRLGIQTLLAVSQVLDQTAARLRVSTQVRTLAEMAIVRICHLQDLDEIAMLVEQLRTGEVAVAPASSPQQQRPMPAAPAKKNDLADANSLQPRPPAGGMPAAQATPTPPPSDPRPEAGAAMRAAPTAESIVKLNDHTAAETWQRLREALGGAVAELDMATKITADGQGRLVVSFPESQKFNRDRCQRPANLSRIEAALCEVLGGRTGLILTTHNDPAGAPAAQATQRPSPKKQQADAAAEPFVQRAVELFDADPGRLRYVAPIGEEKNT
jgi:DNA polymerase III gamma/tau subunit